MKFLNTKFSIVLVFSLIFSGASAQQLPISVTTQVDSLFKEWSNTNTPGCAIGIVRNDSLIYSKGYGMSNLEYDIPITPETVFYMASVSKQFTGYAIVLLTNEGKLKMDEDIHVYLPWVPDFKRKITVRHLLNHTSGLRDNLSMAQIGGLGEDGVVTQQLALNYIKNSTALNFEPGEKYAYSNTNYVLLAEIVKAVSGRSLKDFSEARILKPLGMTRSGFVDEPNTLIKNRATSYTSTGTNIYKNSLHNVYTLGDGGMFSNIIDMAKWASNLYEHKVGNEKDITQLIQTGKLNNGNNLTYASGINVNHYKGFKQYTHAGALAGYRTNIAVFPEVKMAFIILSNLGNFSAITKTNELADLFLKNYIPYTTNPPIKPSNSILTDTAKAIRFSGSYISEDGLRFNLKYQNEQLFIQRFGGQPLLLTELTKDTTALMQNLQHKLVFKISGKDTIIHQHLNEYNRILSKYTIDSILTNKQLKSYSGIYYSHEADTRLRITIHAGELMINSFKNGESKLKIMSSRDMFLGNTNLRFFWDANKQVVGFEINDGRILRVRFDKIE